MELQTSSSAAAAPAPVRRRPSTPARIAASRANGAKSRGPVTAAGKARSSRNSTRHGLLSKPSVFSHDEAETYRNLHVELRESLRPATPAEEVLIETLAAAHWGQIRASRAQTAAMNAEIASLDPSLSPATRAAIAFRNLAEHSRTLDVLYRYEAHFDRLFTHALTALVAGRKRQVVSCETNPSRVEPRVLTAPAPTQNYQTNPTSTSKQTTHRFSPPPSGDKIHKTMNPLKACMLVFAALASVAAAPKIDKVEPPNWWVPHTYNPIQILLTGAELNGATVTTASKGFKIEVRRISGNGHYLFAYLDIAKNARPGTYKFEVKTASGATGFDFSLDRPLDPKGRFQGFTPDDVIYLIMPDRFADGDPSNDSPPEFPPAADRKNPSTYHGGDLKGIRDHLAYLKDLGVTGVWVTPITKNSVSGQTIRTYHGYSASDFYAVEPRFGTMKDFQDLVNAAHSFGLKIVQDQVANHSGNRIPWSADLPTPTWYHYADRQTRPRNNFDIGALADPYARPKRTEIPVDGWFNQSMPDLNQEDPFVSDYLIENALWWIGMTGIDAIRQDTYPYVGRAFWEKYETAVARQYPSFVVTGEITASTPPVLSFFEGGTRRRGIDTKLPSILDFPLESALRQVFAEGQPMTKLVDILAQDSLYMHPEMLVVFPGNHDQPRFLTAAKDNAQKLMMAEAFTLTTRRVAHLYYGDEIAMQGGRDPDNRRDFPGGWPGDPVNAFTESGRTGDAATVFNWTRSLLHFRQDHPALRRGSLTQLLSTPDQYAYLRTSPEENVLIVLNRAGAVKPLPLDVDDVPLPNGTHMTSFTPDVPDVIVASGKVVIDRPAEIQIYWSKH